MSKANSIIAILIILNLIGLVVIGFLLYKINIKGEPNIIADTVYNNIEINIIANNIEKNNNMINNENNNENHSNKNSEQVNLKQTSQWELTLVNYENSLPEYFAVELSAIDKIRKFDSRAINYLNDMLLDMKEQNVKGIWIQSAYRSIDEQSRVFNDEIQKQMDLRKIKKRS